MFSGDSAIKVAFARAIATAVVVGVLGFLGTWATTSEAKTLIISALTPAFTVFAVRLGWEGATLDRKK